VSKLDGGKRGCAVFALCAATAIALPAQTFTSLFGFDGTDGLDPQLELVQATDGNLYGTTYLGGTGANCTLSQGCGTIFKITPSGTLTTLYSFCSQSGCTDGLGGYGLIQATNGDFYGTAPSGGAHNFGTVFKITPAGTLTTLHSFCSHTGCPDGAYPNGPLVQATNGDFYGTTEGGSVIAPCVDSCGTIFKITPSGTLTTLYRFCSQSGCTDGSGPLAGLVQAALVQFGG
jgi:uncharacterized repeat protein (TIGR03803 family)